MQGFMSEDVYTVLVLQLHTYADKMHSGYGLYKGGGEGFVFGQLKINNT